ncbi:MAG: hypothetical protein AAFY88_01675 [Acidobacteriota bacterium]
MSEPTTLTIDEARLHPAEDLAGPRNKALAVAVMGLLATVAGYFVFGPEVFFLSYWTAWIYWIGVPIGLLTLCLLTHVSGGRWGVMMHRIQLSAGKTIPLFFLLGLPVLFGGGLEVLFPWVRPEAASDALVLEKTGYLKLYFAFEGKNPDWMASLPGFIPRYFMFFALWAFWAWKISSLGRKHDETGDKIYKKKAQKWSAGGLVVFTMVATFASIDWIMSTDPHWFSSLYGPQLMLWQVITAVCFTIPLLIFFANRQPLDRIIRRVHFHDYGKWMLAFTMVWGYFSVSQFLIIWSANLPEEVPWYLYRNTPGWQYYTILVVIFTFFVPFLILLSQDIKFKPKVLLRVAMLILVARWFDYYWQMAPNLHHDGVSLHLFDIAPMLGIGGLWVWLFLGQLKGVIVPVHEAEIKEALADG